MGQDPEARRNSLSFPTFAPGNGSRMVGESVGWIGVHCGFDSDPSRSFLSIIYVYFGGIEFGSKR